MFYGSTAIRDEPELPDYESESDLSNIDENKIIKETGDDSSDFTDNNSICNDDNISESDHVKSKTILGKDKCTSWNSEPPRRRRTVQQNVIHEKEGVHASVPTYTASTTFNSFLTKEMIDLIVQLERNHSNQKGKSAYGDNWKESDETELLAWIGSVLRAGLDYDNFRPVDELFSIKTGPPLYRASMSRNRFKELVRCIRFDDMSTRANRKDGEQGRIAPIHELWEKFIEACKKNYSAGPYVTIDESLLAFRGRCLFKVYMPSKPGKYGIKVWSMVDASNAYLLNA